MLSEKIDFWLKNNVVFATTSYRWLKFDIISLYFDAAGKYLVQKTLININNLYLNAKILALLPFSLGRR